MTLHDFIGLPYEARGIPPLAADCYTLAAAYAKAVLGQDWPEYFYDINEDGTAAGEQPLIKELHALDPAWRRVGSVQHGTLIIYQIRGLPRHCGIALGDGLMLHTLAGRASVIEPMAHWKKNELGYFDWIRQDA